MMKKGMPFYKHRNKIRELVTDLTIVERWHWKLDYVRSLSFDDKMSIISYLNGVTEEEIREAKKK